MHKLKFNQTSWPLGALLRDVVVVFDFIWIRLFHKYGQDSLLYLSGDLISMPLKYMMRETTLISIAFPRSSFSLVVDPCISFSPQLVNIYRHWFIMDVVVFHFEIDMGSHHV